MYGGTFRVPQSLEVCPTVQSTGGCDGERHYAAHFPRRGWRRDSGEIGRIGQGKSNGHRRPFLPSEGPESSRQMVFRSLGYWSCPVELQRFVVATGSGTMRISTVSGENNLFRKRYEAVDGEFPRSEHGQDGGAVTRRRNRCRR